MGVETIDTATESGDKTREECGVMLDWSCGGADSSGNEEVWVGLEERWC